MNVIEVSNLSKTFTLGTSIFAETNIYRALDNLSFNVQEGQRLGIIGSNGAGKSTLLKILSRITSPTSGEARIIGTVGSLLEVGTGFHPELTGRENIFLNGSVLGMSTRKIKSRFDEIIEFSGISKFIDTPIKRYSSGMQTRLAFSVAAFLEPDIMIVDEVLAVGDVEFQERSINKLEDLTSSGRTILFVSHNMAMIRKVCNRCILLDQGKIINDSEEVGQVISGYLKSDVALDTMWQNADRAKFPPLEPVSLSLTAKDEKLVRACYSNEDVFLVFDFVLSADVDNLAIGYHLYTRDLEEVFYSYNVDNRNYKRTTLKAGKHTLSVKVPTDILNINEYVIKLAAGLVGDRSLFSAEESKITIKFNVIENRQRSNYWYNKNNVIAPLLDWELS